MAMWKMVSKLSDKQLQEAFAYLLRMQSGAEQTDPHFTVAAQCIALVLENRRKVREGEL
jgi:cytochrome c553